MIYRVIIKVGYLESFFDFDSVDNAGKFAEIVLKHHTPNEDNKKKVTCIVIRVIDPSVQEEDDD